LIDPLCSISSLEAHHKIVGKAHKEPSTV
jgi:hypothetical protein